MDTNIGVYRYIQDEYMSPIVSGHKVSQLDRENLTKEFLSALKITDKHDKNSSRGHNFFLAALAKLIPGTF